MLADRSLHTESFRDAEFGNYHWFLRGAPDEWAEAGGATHTLVLDGGNGERPLILKKTVAYVGVDEDERGVIVWEKWDLKWDPYLNP